MIALMERRSQDVAASVTAIANQANISRETTKRAVRWLIENGVVERRLGANGTNIYRVRYSTPTRVTSDPGGGSPMTLATRVPGSPVTLANAPKTVPDQGECKTTIEVLVSRDNLDMKGSAASGTGTVMILGSDPDETKVTEADTRKKSQKPQSDISTLVSYFVHHPTTIMSKRYSHQEQSILRRTLKLLLNTGLSRQDVRQIIDKFLATERFRESERTVLLFAMKDIQQELMSNLGSVVAVQDPILNLMLQDFTRSGDNAPPWDQGADEDLRQAVAMRGLDACYRYPELVASLALAHSGEFRSPQFINTLTALNDLISGLVANKPRTDLAPLLDDLAPLPLPKELRTLSNASLRPDAGTIAQAIYTYRRMENAS
jgi:hypothetical protein